VNFDTKCVARHSGLWAVEPRWFQTQWAAIRTGTMVAMDVEDAEERSSVPTAMTEDGIALIAVNGPLMKGASKFGNVDTNQVRAAVRGATANTNVRAIVIQADSPGGSIAGIDNLANDVANAAKAKPTYVQVDDLAASAMYWVASQATGIFANPTDEIGSIGVYTVVEDSSKAAEAAGIKVHVVSTGGMKGAFADGVEVTEEQLAFLKSNVDEANRFFLQAIRKGRGMSESKVAAVATGEWWYAEAAKSLGLIDGVQRMDDTLAMIRKEMRLQASAARAKRQVAIARAR